MNRSKFVLVSSGALLGVLLVAGCQATKTDTAASAAPSAAAPAVATQAPPSVPAPTAVTGDIPTSEDFEQQAEDQINPQNMEQELDKLEKEISP